MYTNVWALNWKIGDKIGNLEALYRSQSQSQDDFEVFTDNLEMTLEILAQKNLFLITAIGDFNAKSSNRYNKDIATFEGYNWQYNFTAWIKSINYESTHML